jgi:periplasmic binding family protein
MNRRPQFSKASAITAFITATALLCSQADAQEKSIVVASTTSTQDSGLFDYLLPIVKEKTGIAVKVLAQGTGQALDTARRGDADVVFVHAKSAEEKFLAEGFGVKRYPVMYNDFILIGPKDDPAGVKGRDISAALRTIKTKAQTSPSLPFGRMQASTSRTTQALGTRKSDKGWVLRSTWRRHRTPMCCQTAELGLRLRTGTVSPSLWKATSVSSTSTA